jgi:hypothetical protein
LRYIYYALWSVFGLAVAGFLIFLLFFVHYERPSGYERWQRAETRRNVERMERETREYQARETAKKAEYAARLEKIAALNSDVESKWRADVEAARLTAEPGAVPPMLKVVEIPNAVTVTNLLDDQAVCVSLQRVAHRSSRANDYDRCHLDTDTCRELLPRASFRFPQYATGNPPACQKSPLEFRVGTPLNPEPSWWSRSALEDFDARPAPEPLRTQSEDLWPLRGNIAELNNLLAESDRVQRWRHEFGPRVDTTRVEKD